MPQTQETPNLFNPQDMKRMEDVLFAQASSLNALFENLARTSLKDLGRCFDSSTNYMRLALKAQAQCRVTFSVYEAMRKTSMEAHQAAQQSQNNQEVSSAPSAQKKEKQRKTN